MRKLVVTTIILTSVLIFGELLVYTYDSMVSGLGKEISKMFEEKYGEKVKFIAFGDAGSTLSRLILEGKRTKADIILGLDQNLLVKAIKAGVLLPYKPKNIENVRKDLLIFKNYYAAPFDYGAIAVVYNTEKVKNPPKSFEDLLDRRFKRRIVVEDPRTSSTGLAFLLWTIGVFGEDYLDYWKKLNKNLLTITAGWDEAFEMLERGEADLMVSYITDEAYSYYYYKSSKFSPALFKEGMYVQIEYVGICKYTKNLEIAKKFVEFMLSKDVQELVPLNQWMLPAVSVKLPTVFKEHVPRIDKIVTVDPEKVQKNLERWIDEWAEIITNH